MIGVTLQDKYVVEDRIGRGGFGSVYRGQHLTLKMPVAIKFLEPTRENTRFRERFLREAESLAMLRHPGIVTVYDYAEYNGQPYIVMELVRGPSLLELAKEAALELPQICAIARKICQAMSYAHGQGIIHQDLSLNNVMIEPEEHGGHMVKILDFGLAKLIHSERSATGDRMVGTLLYMAPEMIRHQEVDARVDIFAFGVGLCKLVSGQFPFEAEHPAAIMYLILNDFRQEFGEQVPQRMNELILRCLEKDPQNRASSFEALIPELKAIEMSTGGGDAGVLRPLSGIDQYADTGRRRNPYLNRVMITNHADFFGRKKEIRKIYSRLDAPHPQSISIVGERRIGKSSLLNYVYQAANREEHMAKQKGSLFAYMDFQREADYDVPKFIDFLFNMFSYETQNGRDYTSREKTLDQLKVVIEQLNEAGKRIVILMDEFEAITHNPNFEDHFFSFLRSLANSYNVAYVTSSRDDLQKMCHNKDIADSPFFNIFSNLPLRTFTREEALELIARPSEAEGFSLEPHADRILDLAGLFPLFLQIACSNVFEYLVEDPGGEIDWEEIAKSHMDEVEQHYRFVWERMDGQSRDNLQRIASGRSVRKRHGFVIEDLERRGYLVSSDGHWRLCSSAFRNFVARQAEMSSGPRRLFGRLGKRT